MAGHLTNEAALLRMFRDDGIDKRWLEAVDRCTEMLPLIDTSAWCFKSDDRTQCEHQVACIYVVLLKCSDTGRGLAAHMLEEALREPPCFI